MKRSELEHVIRAAGEIADEDTIVVVGSQAVLGQFPDAPAELCISNEADVYPLNYPERWDVIDGSIGELSPFHDTYGYYAQGVEEGTAVLPEGWKRRLIEVRGPGTRGVRGLCLEIHDLVISKYVANRPKDACFIEAAIRHNLVNRAELERRLEKTPIDESTAAGILASIERHFQNRPGT